ncbi:hypothetical protein CRM22_006494 [Opisthorchis felineus]|uniref:Uncharacterized protein n=2 Tax=Opisthorchis felineus TaxID=147828 RepID=A0A4V3SED5_OPIFE|nr:hypothetical protein CRM22_006494 [Opisthorchis felineus]TGZ64218.1 hypothetical protein CRM22_006494 [Opisthorchis felineus]
MSFSSHLLQSRDFLSGFIFIGTKMAVEFRKKLLVVGDGECGKTSLLIVFSKGVFPQQYVPTVFDTFVKDIVIDNKRMEFTLWDSAGQENYDRLRTLSYPDTDVIILCFSIAYPDSFENVRDKWISEIKEFCPETPVILVGLKKDLRADPTLVRTLRQRRQQPVKTEAGRAMAKDIKAACYLECSAKYHDGVTEVFEAAARVTLRKGTTCTMCTLL